ncbi:RNA polymerase sigma factor [Streptomyces sp. P1-3]|uniref:RNA polymerase sigma factor n=1 Tax=Streptomyces sp. P1-3 TaxID=3421658 RepID=UPI003D366D5E
MTSGFPSPSQAEPSPDDEDTLPLPVIGEPSEPEPGPRPGATRPAEPEPRTTRSAETEPGTTRPVGPAAAFDALYARHIASLTHQTYLLTGSATAARRSVEAAFRRAWQHWPEVAVDGDPAGWIRAAAYEYALSPWPWPRPRSRSPKRPSIGGRTRIRDRTDARTGTRDDRSRLGPDPETPRRAAAGSRRAARTRPPLLDALLCLPRSYRRALLLYDGVCLGLPETAAESEATTRATANRITHAHEALAERLPELREAAPADRSLIVRERLAELAGTQPIRTREARAVRLAGERAARRWTRAALTLTAALVVGTGLATVITPGGGTPASEPARPSPTVPAGPPDAPRAERDSPPRPAP